MSVSFDNIINFRDVGKTVNDYLGRKIVREGVLYRSARPDEASPADRRKLKDELRIRTVVDLRTKTEHLKQAQKREADLAVPALLQSNEALAGPVQIPGLQYREIKVTGRPFERFLLSQLSWWSYFKFLFLFLSGYRMRAISLLGREVMQPRGLVGLGLITLDQSGGEIAKVRSSYFPLPFSPSPSPLLPTPIPITNTHRLTPQFLQTLITPSSPPVLLHCTQGKDRTGLLVALALMVLGVPTSAIEHDYLLSQAGLETEKEARLREISEIGLTAEWGDTPLDFVVRVQQHVETKYGGIAGYLDSIGFGSADQRKLIEVLGA
ncbi:tyrosine/serine protein phosphatase [Hypoxylon sp. NC1633]|nr:tyrosine/serine protein phosphatase [Hypoxylon sp. NC1633]